MGIFHKPYIVLTSIILLTAFIFLFSSCDKGSSIFYLNMTKKAKEDCIAPHNPFNDGSGHDAGFNWAQDNGVGCIGHSDSFNEGCEEYFRQLNQYNACLAVKNK